MKDEDIQQLYDLVKDKLTSPEDNHLLTLEESKNEVRKKLVEGRSTELALKGLNEIKAKIKDPADFERILKEENLEVTPVEKYKKGMVLNGAWPSEAIESSLAKLGLNETSDAFAVQKGAMICKVTQVYSFDEKKFEEEKNAFRDRLVAVRSQEELGKLLEKLREKLTLNLELMKEIFPAEEK